MRKPSRKKLIELILKAEDEAFVWGNVDRHDWRDIVLNGRKGLKDMTNDELWKEYCDCE